MLPPLSVKVGSKASRKKVIKKYKIETIVQTCNFIQKKALQFSKYSH